MRARSLLSHRTIEVISLNCNLYTIFPEMLRLEGLRKLTYNSQINRRVHFLNQRGPNILGLEGKTSF